MKAWSAVVAGVAVVVTAGTVWAATRVSSPDQVAANAAPPAASAVTVPVERRVLRGTIVSRGDVVAADGVDVLVGAGGGLGGGDSAVTDAVATDPSAVVTATPVDLGGAVVEGDVVVVVSGRPVLALGGDLPAYRDLGPGATGPDVVQLQDALERLGLGIGDDDLGYFGTGTQEGVQSLYERVGFDAPLTSPDAEANVADALAAVSEAIRAQDGARDELADATQPPNGVERRQAQLAVEDAQRALDDAVTAADAARAVAAADLTGAQAAFDAASRPSLPKGDLAAARAVQTAALRDQELVAVQQRNAVTDAELAATTAGEALAALPPAATAQERLDAQRAVDGATRDLAAARLSAANANADAQAAVAAAGAEVLRLSTAVVDPVAQATAKVALDDATVAAASADREGRSQVAAASSALESAVLAAAGLSAPVDASSLQRSLDAAGDQLARSYGSAITVVDREGVMLARQEVVFVPSFPASLAALNARVGEAAPVDGPLLTIGSGGTQVRVRVPVGEAGQVREGLPVSVEVDPDGATVTATVVGVEAPDGNDPTTGAVAVVEAADGFGLDRIGENVKVTIETASTSGEVLVVASSGVYNTADGGTWVEVAVDGETRRVAVEVGLVADGWVEVVPLDPGGLAPGDLVVVGRDALEPEPEPSGSVP